MNSAVGPSFKEKFTEIHTCGSHEQCTGPIQKTLAQAQTLTRLYPNGHLKGK